MSKREGGRGWTDHNQPKIVGYVRSCVDPRITDMGMSPLFAKGGKDPNAFSEDLGAACGGDGGGDGLLGGMINAFRNFLED